MVLLHNKKRVTLRSLSYFSSALEALLDECYNVFGASSFLALPVLNGSSGDTEFLAEFFLCHPCGDAQLLNLAHRLPRRG